MYTKIFKPLRIKSIIVLSIIIIIISWTPVFSQHSERTFTITNQTIINNTGNDPRIEIKLPNKQKPLIAGCPYNILWDSKSITTIKIEYSTDGGMTWQIVAEDVPAFTEYEYEPPQNPFHSKFSWQKRKIEIRSYIWHVPDFPTTEGRIRISDLNNPAIYDVSEDFNVTTNATQSGWTEQTTGTTISLNCASIVDRKVAWVGGAAIFKTTNGGSNWTRVFTAPATKSISAISTDVALICVNSSNVGQIWRTTNGGSTWTTVYEYSATGAEMIAVQMVNDTAGYALGYPISGMWNIVKTTDGGVHWTTLPGVAQFFDEYVYSSSFKFFDENAGWFGSDYGRVYYTTNGGTSWSYSSAGGSDIFGIAFANDQLGMTGQLFLTTARTTNGGVSWTPATSVPGDPFALFCIPATTPVPIPRWWMIVMDSIFVTTDHGTTWIPDHSSDGYLYNKVKSSIVCKIFLEVRDRLSHPCIV